MHVVHVPSPQDEASRQLMRDRGVLQKEVLQHRDRMRKLLATLGCWDGIDHRIADIAAVSSCSCYARSKPTCRPSSMCISLWTTTARTRRRRLRLDSLAIRASTFISLRPPPHGSIRWNAGLQPSPNNTSAAARVAQPDNLSKRSAKYLDLNNANPNPFVWTKSADDILASIRRFCLRISDSEH